MICLVAVVEWSKVTEPGLMVTDSRSFKNACCQILVDSFYLKNFYYLSEAGVNLIIEFVQRIG